MSVLTVIIFGLIPGFLAGSLAAFYRQTARVRADNSESFFKSPSTRQ